MNENERPVERDRRVEGIATCVFAARLGTRAEADEPAMWKHEAHVAIRAAKALIAALNDEEREVPPKEHKT